MMYSVAQKIPFLFFILFSVFAWSQQDPFAVHVVKDAAALSPSELPSFEEYKKNPDHSNIIYIAPKALTYALKDRDKIIVLDARNKDEFNISHIKDAHLVEYDKFTSEMVWTYNRDARVVVYSSNNERAAILAQYLKLMGFLDVELLEGGLIGWKNMQYDVYDTSGKTEKVHVGNKENFKLLHYGIAVF